MGLRLDRRDTNKSHSSLTALFRLWGKKGNPNTAKQSQWVKEIEIRVPGVYAARICTYWRRRSYTEKSSRNLNTGQSPWGPYRKALEEETSHEERGLVEKFRGTPAKSQQEAPKLSKDGIFGLPALPSHHLRIATQAKAEGIPSQSTVINKKKKEKKSSTYNTPRNVIKNILMDDITNMPKTNFI